jgi:serine/threonine protein kinase
LQEAGYGNLAHLLTLQARQGQTLLAVAARYFFRRAVEEDGRLFQGLTFSQLEALQQGQEQAFAALHQTLTGQGGRLEELLASVQAVVAQTHEAVLDIQQEQRRQGNQARDIYDAVLGVQRRLDLMHREVRPRDSLSIRTDAERQLVKQVISRYRALPEEQRRGLPALLNAVGKLEVAAGDFATAQRDFTEVASLVSDVQAKGEAHANAYRAALERRDWDAALAELLEAVKLDGRRFAPFPVGKYRPVRILGAGGFGVAFLCRHRQLDADVVVKALTGDDLEHELDVVFAEARALWELDHPGIIRLLDCGYLLPSTKQRPYMVMHYFDGQTLDEHVHAHGTLSPADLAEVARLMAQGLHAAHSKNILHRDVKPANVLVRKEGGAWQVKLIDFGLAMTQRTLQGASTSRAGNTLVAGSIAGTLDYAAPEQLGKLRGVRVGPPADIYGFAKTCCYALFDTTEPTFQDWQNAPKEWAELLGHCLNRNPERRPANFADVLDRLPRLPPASIGRGMPAPRGGQAGEPAQWAALKAQLQNQVRASNWDAAGQTVDALLALRPLDREILEIRDYLEARHQAPRPEPPQAPGTKDVEEGEVSILVGSGRDEEELTPRTAGGKEANAGQSLPYLGEEVPGQPVDNVEQLARQLDLLSGMCRRDPTRGGELLAHQVRLGRLAPGLVEGLEREPGAVVLRFFPEWQLAAQQEEALRLLLNDARLLCVYAGLELKPEDDLPHVGMQAFLAHLQADPQLAPERQDLARLYASEGQALLVRSLQTTDPRPLPLGHLKHLSGAHCQLLTLVPNNRPLDQPAAGGLNALLSEHLVSLLAFLLAYARPGKEGGPEAALLPAIEMSLGWCPRPDSRVNLFHDVGQRVGKMHRRLGISPEQADPLVKSLWRTLQPRMEEGEAAWHAHYLRQALRTPDDPPERLRRQAVLPVLDQVPSVASPEGAQTPFGAWLAPHLDQETWQQLAERLRKGCTGSKWPQEVRKWFDPSEGRKPLIDRMDQLGLLAAVGDEFVRLHAGAKSGLPALVELTRLPLPPSVAKPVRARLAEILLARLGEVHALAAPAAQQDPHWVPPLDQAKKDIRDLCEPLAFVGEEVQPGWLRFFWRYLARCLPSLSDDLDAVGACFPRIYDLGMAQKARLVENPDLLWSHLFKWAAALMKRERFPRLFIACGESLLASGRQEGLAQVVEARKDPDLANFFWEEKAGGWMSSRTLKDRLLPYLGTTPSAAARGQLHTEEAMNAVINRSWLAAEVYEQESMEKLAQTYCLLGCIDGSRDPDRIVPSHPDVTALALFTFITLHGRDVQKLSGQIARVLDRSFWKTFYENTREQGGTICGALEDWLQQERLTEEEARSLVRPLRKKYGAERR